MNKGDSEAFWGFCRVVLVGILGSTLLAVCLSGCDGGGGNGGDADPDGEPVDFVAEVFIAEAAFPVTLAFAPDGRLFFTELKTGNIRVAQGGELLAEAFATVPVATVGEQGLLGLAFDPDFETNGFVYIYHTHPDPLRNRVVRFTAVGNTGTDETVIVDNLPVGTVHNGGRVRFGPDGKLFVSLGDTGPPANAQDVNSPAGKLLRFNKDGTIPDDNPIAGNPLFALGLRNVFGNEGAVLDREVVVDGEFGGLIDVTTGPDGNIYFCSTTAIMRLVPSE